MWSSPRDEFDKRVFIPYVVGNFNTSPMTAIDMRKIAESWHIQTRITDESKTVFINSVVVSNVDKYIVRVNATMEEYDCGLESRSLRNKLDGVIDAIRLQAYLNAFRRWWNPTVDISISRPGIEIESSQLEGDYMKIDFYFNNKKYHSPK